MHQPLTVIASLALALTALSLPEASATVSRAPVRIVYVSGHNAFDWGDAGIGVAAGAGITLLGVGGALAISQRHSHPIGRPRRPGADRASPRSASQSTHQRREVQ
jgi:hypothetical protein